MNIQSATSAPLPAQSSLGAASQLSEILAGGTSLDGPAFAIAAEKAGPEAVQTLLKGLPPADQGFLEAALSAQGLGHLLGAVGQVASAPGHVADAAIYPQSERNSDNLREAQQNQWMNEMRGQAELDSVLAPYLKEDRPSAQQAWSVEVRSPIDRKPGQD